MLEVIATAEIELRVEVAGFDTTIEDSDVAQAVQDALGHAGAIVNEVIQWERSDAD